MPCAARRVDITLGVLSTMNEKPSTAFRIPNYSGPLVHVEWEMRPDEWEELRTVLLNNRTPFIEHLIEDGAL